ncbi:MAG: Na/Pi cotransporter family protein [Phycisphaerae bacterium]|nr:Na/Pi cotransporter family protein [Phycisphaerae bacterium]
MSTSTIISILGGLGLFLLGMALMTEGLRAFAGSSLRTLLSRAAATPARGVFWGGLVTLIVQSSSATTMTTIGLVSAGLLTFPQALGVVFGANIGTTGTAWLVALVGVKVSLNAAAMPLVFCGALLRLLGRGRMSGAGGALAGFALLLVGLTVMQEGMAGLATRLNPSDLPSVSDGWGGALGVLKLVLVGIVMTTVMQSSSASIAVTLSALHAGAIGADQAAALVIGQNIGSAVSSAIAAVGANTPAKRTAVAHVLFNSITAVVALVAFPIYSPLVLHGAGRLDPTILLAAFHTTYNAVGIALLLPLIRPFARLVERVVPQRGPVLTRFLDRSVLTLPDVAVEAVRRTIGETLRALCESIAPSLQDLAERRGRSEVDSVLVRSAEEAMNQARQFLSDLSQPPASEVERRRLAGALHALDHTARLAEDALDLPEAGVLRGIAEDEEVLRAAGLCARALRLAASLVAGVAEGVSMKPGTEADVAEKVAELARGSAELADLRRSHRRATLGAAASPDADAGDMLRVDSAIVRIDTVRELDRLAYHAWRAASHLVEDRPAATPSQPPAALGP